MHEARIHLHISRASRFGREDALFRRSSASRAGTDVSQSSIVERDLNNATCAHSTPAIFRDFSRVRDCCGTSRVRRGKGTCNDYNINSISLCATGLFGLGKEPENKEQAPSFALSFPSRIFIREKELQVSRFKILNRAISRNPL